MVDREEELQDALDAAAFARDLAVRRAERAEAALRDIAALDPLTATPAPILLVAIQRAQEALEEVTR